MNFKLESQEATTKPKSKKRFDFGACELHQNTPYKILDVSHSQLSIARYSGGIKYNGDYFTYFPLLDILVRDDVLKLANKLGEDALYTP